MAEPFGRPLGRRVLVVALVATRIGATAPVVAAPASTIEAREPSIEPAREDRFAGLTLSEALLALRSTGFKLFFTSNVVTPDMRVETEPAAGSPLAVLQQLLAAHGLEAREGPGDVWVVTRVPPSAAAESASSVDAATPEFRYSELLEVRPSRIPVLGDAVVGALGLDRDAIAALPHLGNDLFRSLSLLPGIASNDVSASFHVRGARRDETLVTLDGQELFDAYHLHDYDDAQSVVAPDVLADAELSTGGFAATHGDRMSGVLDLRTPTVGDETVLRLGAGILGVSLGGNGRFAGRRGAWLTELRRGAFDVVGRLLGDEDPETWDGFGKATFQLGSRGLAHASLLRSRDRLDFADTVDGETKRYRTDYADTHAWAGGDALLGRDLLVESALGLARIDRDRRGAESEEDGRFAIRDRRATDVSEIRQTWGLAAPPRHELELGFLWRHFGTDYDYTARLTSDDPLAALRPDGGELARDIRARYPETHLGAYLNDRFHLAPPLDLDLGIRYDQYRVESARRVSPRAQLAWRLGDRSILRAAWGRYDQSQRTYEVDVEDGETARLPLERSQHRIVGFETLLGSRGSKRAVALGVELYRRTVGDPRPRFENLFEPINTFPEVEPVRVRVAPEESRAAGAEISLRGGASRLRWWAAYSHASTDDKLDGRWVPRLFDQTHALDLSLDFAFARHWRMDVAFRAHSGWPTTPISVVRTPGTEDGITPVLGALDSRRLPAYHRLDLRVTRNWVRERTQVDVYLDLQNLYDRENVAGYDLTVDEASVTVLKTPEAWPGFLASAGVRVQLGRSQPAP